MSKGTGSISEIRRKVTKTHEFIYTSYHEAGHVIYALLHLMKVSSVFIAEDKKRTQGLACYDTPGDLNVLEDPELINILIKAEIGVSYAGLIAERALFKSISGSRKIPTFIDGATEDNKCARNAIEKYNLAPPGPKRKAFKQKLMREVQNELYTHWDAVTLIAHALFHRRRLKFEDIQTILIKKSRNKKFWKDQFKKINHYHNNCEVLDEKDLKSIILKI